MTGSESSPALPRSFPYAVTRASTLLASPNSPMKSCGCAFCSVGHPVEDRADPVDRRVGVAADLELHERGVAVRGDLPAVPGSERRADVLDDPELRDPRDDVAHGRRELGIARP